MWGGRDSNKKEQQTTSYTQLPAQEQKPHGRKRKKITAQTTHSGTQWEWAGGAYRQKKYEIMIISMFSQCKEDVNILQRNKQEMNELKSQSPSWWHYLGILDNCRWGLNGIIHHRIKFLWIVCSWPLPGCYILSTIRCQGAFAAYFCSNVLPNSMDLRVCQLAPITPEITPSLFVYLRYLQSHENLPNIISLMDLSKLKIGEPPRDYMPNHSPSIIIVNLNL